MKIFANVLFWFYELSCTLIISICTWVLCSSAGLLTFASWLCAGVTFWIMFCVALPLVRFPMLVPSLFWRVERSGDSVTVSSWIFNSSGYAFLFMTALCGIFITLNPELRLPRSLFTYLFISSFSVLAIFVTVSIVFQYRPFYSRIEFRKDVIVIQSGAHVYTRVTFSDIRIDPYLLSGEIKLKNPVANTTRAKFLGGAEVNKVKNYNPLRPGMVGKEGILEISNFYARD